MEKIYSTSCEKQILDLITVKYSPAAVLSFGEIEYNWKRNSCFLPHKEDGEGYYYFLIITYDVRKEHDKQNYLNTHLDNSNCIILCHTTKAFYAAVKESNYFFLQILQSGKILYQDAQFELPTINTRISLPNISEFKRHYIFHKRAANSFQKAAEECLINESYGIASFLFHQVIEQICIGLIKMQTGYNCQIHNIRKLLVFCQLFFPKRIELLNPDAKCSRLVTLLERSYVNTRYNSEFEIIEEDVLELAEYVDQIKTQFENLCDKS